MIAASERLAVDIADARALKARAASGQPDALRSAARQFESMLVAQMLKTMRETRFSDEDDPMTGGDSMKLYRELLDQQWAARMASGRGLGFAEMMVKAMENRGMAPEAAPAPTTKPTPPIAGSTLAVATTPSTNSRSAAMQSTVEAAPASPLDRKQQFIDSMRPHAEAAATATGIPARFILAHAALESGWGAREIRNESGAASHNLFGIKAGRNWNGASVETLTTEYRQGMPMKMAQRFRAYDDYSAGFTDYARLLATRHGAALSNDADAFANGLAAGGYATDPAYAGKLKAVIASVAMAGV
jgi:peptidoglycan hydrolase FlgJ